MPIGCLKCSMNCICVQTSKWPQRLSVPFLLPLVWVELGDLPLAMEKYRMSGL